MIVPNNRYNLSVFCFGFIDKKNKINFGLKINLTIYKRVRFTEDFKFLIARTTSD